MSYPGTFNWTPEAVALLKSLWIIEKLTGSEIANRLGGGLSRSAVMGKISRLGLPARLVRWPEPYFPDSHRNRALPKRQNHSKQKPTAGLFSAAAFVDSFPEKRARLPRSGVESEKRSSHYSGAALEVATSPSPQMNPPKNWLITDFPDHSGDPKFCRYAVTHTTPYRFCGNATEQGESWCPVHGKLVTIPGSKLRVAGKTWGAWS